MDTKHSTFSTALSKLVTSGWWMVLATFFFVCFYYAIYIAVFTLKPQWMLALLGPSQTWESFESMCLWALVAMKLMMWALILMVAWLHLWRSALRKG